MLVHGLPKVGKSYLGVSLPTPLLYMDVEMVGHLLPVPPAQVGLWKDTSRPCPALEPGQTIMRVPIRNSGDADKVIEYLNTGRHPFKGVTLDSLGALQKRVINDAVPDEKAVEIQDWGTILRKMERYCEHLRDLTQHRTKPLQSLLVICPTRYREKQGYGPFLRGQIKDGIGYYFDINGYLYIKQRWDPVAKKQVEERYLRTRRSEGAEGIDAGERVGGRVAVDYRLPDVSDPTREGVMRKNRTFELIQRAVFKEDGPAVAPPARTDRPVTTTVPEQTAADQPKEQ
jgi:hypothetical protein